MGRKLIHDFAIVAAFAAVLPFLFSVASLTSWSRADQELSALKAKEQSERVEGALRANLTRISVVADLLANSREVMDYLLAPVPSRPYIENIVVARFASVKDKVPEIAGWRLIDAKGKQVYPTIDVSNFPTESGFNLIGQDISYKTTIKVDDQYINTTDSPILGYLIADISIVSLKSSVRGFERLIGIPADLGQGRVEFQLSSSPELHYNMAPIVVALAVMMMTSMAAALFLLFKRVLSPIRQITDEVSAKRSGKRLDVSGQHEIEILRAAFKAYVEELEEQTRAVAIASTTQMLAHDVRKPFSMLQIAIDLLRETNDPSEIQSILDDFIPELERARSSVDGLISDVMEVGSTSTQLVQESVSVESIVESSLGEIFRVYPNSDITIDYELAHHNMVNVHVQKVGRVLSNIIGNAVQAISYKGKIWIKTSESANFVTICLGNSGSFIPNESLSKLFDAFFTSGKKGGTGLGLAIAQKVVTAHGGKIWCESQKSSEFPEGKVEFFFTLPIAAGQATVTTAKLPHHSSDITMTIRALTDRARSQINPDQGEAKLEAEIISIAKSKELRLRIIVVDDEAVYRRGVTTMLANSPDLKNLVEICEAEGSTTALALIHEAGAKNIPFDLMITDIDMGRSSLTGFDLVAKVRAAAGERMLISVHSNRIVNDDQKHAITSGADSFIPKPVARAQLLKLILQALMIKQEQYASIPLKGTLRRPKVAVVEDGALILKRWLKVLGSDCEVLGFESPARFWHHCAENPQCLAELTAVITDQHFDGTATKGLDLASEIKRKRPDLPILLASSDIFTSEQLVGKIDHKIGKVPVTFRELPL